MLKTISRLVTGSALAQLLSFLALPIVMRFYTPSDYGVFGASMVYVGIAAIFGTFQAQQAIILPKTMSHARGLFWIGTIGAAGAGALAILIGYLISLIFKITVINESYWLIPLIGTAIFATGLSQCVQAIALRMRAFSEMAWVSVVKAIIVITLQLIFGYYAPSPEVLMLAYVLGELVSAATLWIRATNVAERSLPWRNLARYKVLLKSNKDFCVYGSLQEGLNSASQGVPIIVLGAYFGSAVAGYYAFSTRVLLAPVQLVANAIRQVISVKFAGDVNNNISIASDFIRFTTILACLVLSASFLTFILLPDIYAAAFGNEWKIAGEYASWLIFWAAFLVINIPSTVVFRVLKLQRPSFYYNIFIFALRSFALILCGQYFNATVSIGVFSTIGVVFNMVYIYMAYIYLRKSRRL